MLSVRHENPETGDPSVRHYRIRNLDTGGCYVSTKKFFSDLFELIDYYCSKGQICISNLAHRMG